MLLLFTVVIFSTKIHFQTRFFHAIKLLIATIWQKIQTVFMKLKNKIIR